MIYTTLNKIREHSPCESGWEKLLKHLGKTESDDEPLPLLTILDSNGLNDTLWCLRTVPEHDKERRLFAVWCARKVQHLMTDQRSINALDVAERYANGKATEEELAAARDAAEDAASAAAYAAWDVAYAAARAAAWAAAEDAASAAMAAAYAARTVAAYAARDATDETYTAARTAAGAAADATYAERTAASAEQETELRRIIGG